MFMFVCQLFTALKKCQECLFGKKYKKNISLSFFQKTLFIWLFSTGTGLFITNVFVVMFFKIPAKASRVFHLGITVASTPYVL